MMQKLTFLLLAGATLSFQACGTLPSLPVGDLNLPTAHLPGVPLPKKLSQDEAASGLKEALITGVGVGTDQLQKVGRLVFYMAWEIANREQRLVVDSNKP